MCMVFSVVFMYVHRCVEATLEYIHPKGLDVIAKILVLLEVNI